MASSRGGLPKPVLNSPAQQLESSESAANTSQMDNLITKLSFPDELEKNHKQIVKEEHKKRIQSLRKELDYISATNWRFNSAGAKFWMKDICAMISSSKSEWCWYLEQFYSQLSVETINVQVCLCHLDLWNFCKNPDRSNVIVRVKVRHQLLIFKVCTGCSKRRMWKIHKNYIFLVKLMNSSNCGSHWMINPYFLQGYFFQYLPFIYHVLLSL